jgi:myo-inositol-hexaphosphate 3-phosphohydrolase
MNYLFCFILLFISTNSFAKKNKKTNSIIVKTNLETAKLGGLLGSYDAINYSDSINKNIIFTASPQGLYILNDSSLQIAKGRFGAIDIQPIHCNQTTIISVSIKGDNTIRLYQWNSINKSITEISAGDIPSGVDDIIGIKIISGNHNNTDKLIVLGKRGQIEIWELFVLSWGQLDAKVIESTTLPERCNGLTYHENTIAGTFEKKGAWILPFQQNGKLGTLKLLNTTNIKLPLSGITNFEFENQKYLAFTQRDSSFIYFMNLETNKTSPAVKIYHNEEMKTIQNPQFIINNKNTELYILDYQNTIYNKPDGSNFKIIQIIQLKDILAKLSN